MSQAALEMDRYPEADRLADRQTVRQKGKEVGLERDNGGEREKELRERVGAGEGQRHRRGEREKERERGGGRKEG